jgi:metallo-beta-lactamase family protein
MVRVTCLGGAGAVTGSSYLVESPGGKKVLVDCGMFQGGRQMESRNWGDWGFDPKAVDTLFLTHAHIDHSGRIPKLVKDGFQGRIITSPPTAELCRIMLLDSAHIQEMDAEWQNRKNKRQNRGEIQPLYTTSDAEKSLEYFEPVERDRIITVDSGLTARLRNAGHILGSCILELWVGEGEDKIKVVFSGDLGKKDQLIVRDPHEIFAADYLFVESTYGNRFHRSFEESKEELLEAIRYAHGNGEKVMIPAFAVERTQEIIYILAEFERAGLLPDMPVYLDSPLAIKATEIFRKNKAYYDDEAGAIVDKGLDPFSMPNLKFTQSTQESIRINEQSGPAIIIAGNGMCTAGRIKHHLKHNLWRPGASLVIVGFQARGTTGRRIVDGEKRVRIFRENVAVRARVFTIGGFSAHADQGDLVGWIGNFVESGPRVFVVHGEAAASEALAAKIREVNGLPVHIPKWKERLILKPREMATEEPAAEEVAPDMSAAMLGAIVELERELEELKRRVAEKRPDEIQEEEVDVVKYIQEDIRAAL